MHLAGTFCDLIIAYTHHVAQVNCVVNCPCVQSTALDMAKWIAFHMDHGLTPSGTRLVSLAALAEVHNSVMSLQSFAPDLLRPIFPGGSLQWDYALGWFNGDYEVQVPFSPPTHPPFRNAFFKRLC